MALYECFCFFFFKQKTAYEMRISDWSSDVCSSDLCRHRSTRLKSLCGMPRHELWWRRRAIDRRIDEAVAKGASLPLDCHVGPAEYEDKLAFLMNPPLRCDEAQVTSFTRHYLSQKFALVLRKTVGVHIGQVVRQHGSECVDIA